MQVQKEAQEYLVKKFVQETDPNIEAVYLNELWHLHQATKAFNELKVRMPELFR